MTAEKPGSDLLKIHEAAQYLGVTRRWIYRRIWSGELPASKVGGLYFIRKQNLEALIEQGNTGGMLTEKEDPNERTLKCGYCFRLLESDMLIGEVCKAEDCEQMICTQCLGDGIQHCIQHVPDREQLWQAALEKHRAGEIPLLVRASQARLREINFLQRFQSRLVSISTLRHPLTEETLTVADWEALLEEGDERAEVMRLMNKVLLETEWLTQVPLNAFARFHLPAGKKQKGAPVTILAQAFSRTREMLQQGFDTQPMSAEMLTPRLLKLGEEAQRSGTITLVLLASTTGWDASARDLIEGAGVGTAISHRWMLVYLYDMESREILYNRFDNRARGFAEVFRPLLPAEEIEEVVAAIEKEIGFYDSITMEHATQTFSYPPALLKKAFEHMASGGNYALTEIPDLGLAIVRK